MDFATKIQNRKTTLAVFRRAPVLSSTEAAQATGLSRSTAHRVIEFLRKSNLVLVSGKRATSDASGKKPKLLCLNANYRHILCFQIGIGGLVAGIADLKERLLVETSAAYQEDAPLDDVTAIMKSAYSDMRKQLRLSEGDFAGMAVGYNGVVDSENGVLLSSSNFPSWGNHVPLVEKLKEAFPSVPAFYVDNSNRFDAYAEYRIGQAQGVENFLVMDGHYHGFGGGIVISGALWRGRQSLAGEIGHMTVDPKNGRRCACGSKGCLEVMTSMKALEQSALDNLEKHPDSVLHLRSPAPELTYRKIYDAANTGDKYARSLVSEQARWLAVGINNITLTMAPDLIILQGNFMEGGAYFLNCLKEHSAKLGMPRIPDKASIVYSHLGPNRCLVGMAHFVADQYFETPSLYE